ncbi:hypothetical protein BDN70DRAFT_901106 [Pholiota conissans]|uniref:Uncharacterized protein n=1 Tax=Pholiota conissans TaxID=109636 RepID=A0A9P5YKX5_9AGAR|nr:hypothetical protein BDN70DRAFT_901106 [Pholiota conissans]
MVQSTSMSGDRSTSEQARAEGMRKAGLDRLWDERDTQAERGSKSNARESSLLSESGAREGGQSDVLVLVLDTYEQDEWGGRTERRGGAYESIGLWTEVGEGDGASVDELRRVLKGNRCWRNDTALSPTSPTNHPRHIHRHGTYESIGLTLDLFLLLLCYHFLSSLPLQTRHIALLTPTPRPSSKVLERTVFVRRKIVHVPSIPPYLNQDLLLPLLPLLRTRPVRKAPFVAL